MATQKHNQGQISCENLMSSMVVSGNVGKKKKIEIRDGQSKHFIYGFMIYIQIKIHM